MKIFIIFVDLFPQLDHQKRVIAKSMKMQQWPNKQKVKGKSEKRSYDRSDDSDCSQSRRRSRSRERVTKKKRET